MKNPQFLEKITDYFQKCQAQKTSTYVEIAPATMLSPNIYNYSLCAQFFNEYLSQIAQISDWENIFSGCQHRYYLNDLLLVVNPDGKQMCTIPKTLSESYWMHRDLIKKPGETPDSLLTQALENVHNSEPSPVDAATAAATAATATSAAAATAATSSAAAAAATAAANAANEEDISLKSNLRVRVLRPITVSHNKFPPLDTYHYQDRRTYRSYSNKDVTIHFEILRPIECHKKFEELLLAKPDSKFIIRIIVKNPHKVEKYLTAFSSDLKLLSTHLS